MKKIIIGSLIVALASCSSQNSVKDDNTQNTEKAMVIMYDTIKDIDDNPILVGKIIPDVLKKTDFIDWYDENYAYEVNQTMVDNFKDDLKDYHIDVYMGTWCSDSHREVPALIKILEQANYPFELMNMFAVDDEKKGIDGKDLPIQVDYVPLIIFKKNGEEKGRIVESPINSLEEDIQDIINGTPQTPNYAE